MDDVQTGQEVQTETSQECDGRSLIGALEYGYHLLAANKEEINRLNVFPVPDGDTGTNMLLTWRPLCRREDRRTARAQTRSHKRSIAAL